jgi:hypothetical protein
VIVNRMDSKQGQLGQQLAAVQDLTAETLQMEREAHWPKDREDAVASMFHTVNLGLRQMQPD